MRKVYIIKKVLILYLKASKEYILSWGGWDNLPFSNPIFLGVLNTGILDVENSKPVFDPDFHTEIIIKDEYEDFNLGNTS